MRHCFIDRVIIKCVFKDKNGIYGDGKLNIIKVHMSKYLFLY